jgi:hypothetical protein
MKRGNSDDYAFGGGDGDAHVWGLRRRDGNDNSQSRESLLSSYVFHFPSTAIIFIIMSITPRRMIKQGIQHAWLAHLLTM